MAHDGKDGWMAGWQGKEQGARSSVVFIYDKMLHHNQPLTLVEDDEKGNGLFVACCMLHMAHGTYCTCNKQHPSARSGLIEVMLSAGDKAPSPSQPNLYPLPLPN